MNIHSIYIQETFFNINCTQIITLIILRNVKKVNPLFLKIIPISKCPILFQRKNALNMKQISTFIYSIKVF